MARLAKLKAPTFWLVMSSLIIIVILLYIQKSGIEGFFAEPTYQQLGYLATFTPDPSNQPGMSGTEDPNLVVSNTTTSVYNASTCELLYIFENYKNTYKKYKEPQPTSSKFLFFHPLIYTRDTQSKAQSDLNTINSNSPQKIDAIILKSDSSPCTIMKQDGTPFTSCLQQLFPNETCNTPEALVTLAALQAERKAAEEAALQAERKAAEEAAAAVEINKANAAAAAAAASNSNSKKIPEWGLWAIGGGGVVVLAAIIFSSRRAPTNNSQ